MLLVAAVASPVAGAAQAPGPRGSETVAQAICRLVEGAAAAQRLPSSFLTRLIWRESSFRAGAVSRAGAQGIAQFMPGTAKERGLADPFDPEKAIPEAARLLAELKGRFGNLGLAAAAYNGGPARVAAWLAGRGPLWQETRDYVVFITGRTAEDWAAEPRPKVGEDRDAAGPTCLQAVAALRLREPLAPGAPLAPWGVQLAGNFSKDVALRSWERERQRYASAVGEAQPMIIGTRLRARGSRPYYRVRVPQPTRVAADRLCQRIRALGGACVVLPT